MGTVSEAPPRPDSRMSRSNSLAALVLGTGSRRNMFAAQDGVDEDDVSQKSARSRPSLAKQGSILIKQSATGALTAYQQLDAFLRSSISRDSSGFFRAADDDDDDSMTNELRRLHEFEEEIRHDLEGLDEFGFMVRTPRKQLSTKELFSASDASLPELVCSPESSVMSSSFTSSSNTLGPESGPSHDSSSPEKFTRKRPERSRSNSYGLKRQISIGSYQRLQDALGSIFSSDEDGASSELSAKYETLEQNSSSAETDNKECHPTSSPGCFHVEMRNSSMSESFNTVKTSNCRNQASTRSRNETSKAEWDDLSEQNKERPLVPKKSDNDDDDDKTTAKEHSSHSLLRQLASFAFGHHEYTITSGGTVYVRSYEGGVCVALAVAVVGAQVTRHSVLLLQDQWIASIAAVLAMPIVVTWMEIHSPHSMDETAIAFTILALHFAMHHVQNQVVQQ